MITDVPPAVRKIAERLSRGRSFWRRLPQEFRRAPLKVTPDAALSFLKPGIRAYDPMLFRLSLERARAGLAVWDVGANVGMFALASAARGAQVLAIEPDAFLYRLLMETRDHPRNREFHLEVLCAAVADNPGVANLAIASRGRASSYLEAFSGRSQAGGIRTKCLVPVLTLDLLLDGREPPALVKVDVEGAELAVLKGAKRLLENVRPTILIEVGDSTRTGVIATLRDAGYVVQDYEEMGAASGAQSASGTNLLALPNNRTQ